MASDATAPQKITPESSFPDHVWNNLTQKQKAIALEACKGATDREIAATLNIPVYTVGKHLKKIYRKLEIKGRKGLIPHDPDPWNRLTAEQRAAVTEARKGATAREIATTLGIGLNQVRNHLWRAYRKLGVDGRKELIQDPWSTLTPTQRAVAIEASTGATQREIADKFKTGAR